MQIETLIDFVGTLFDTKVDNCGTASTGLCCDPDYLISSKKLKTAINFVRALLPFVVTVPLMAMRASWACALVFVPSSMTCSLPKFPIEEEKKNLRCSCMCCTRARLFFDMFLCLSTLVASLFSYQPLNWIPHEKDTNIRAAKRAVFPNHLSTLRCWPWRYNVFIFISSVGKASRKENRKTQF